MIRGDIPQHYRHPASIGCRSHIPDGQREMTPTRQAGRPSSRRDPHRHREADWYSSSSQTLDHDDKAELLIGAIRGIKKFRFEVDAGDAGKQITDYGVTVLDTAVPIIGPRM